MLINNEDEALHDAAITVASITELALYTITTAAVVVGMIQGSQEFLLMVVHLDFTS